MNFESFYLPLFITALTGMGGWVYKTGNRTTALEVKMEGLRELIEEKFDNLNRRLDKIESKVDANGKRVH